MEMEPHEAELTHVLAVNTHVQFPYRPPSKSFLSFFFHISSFRFRCVWLCVRKAFHIRIWKIVF